MPAFVNRHAPRDLPWGAGSGKSGPHWRRSATVEVLGIIMASEPLSVEQIDPGHMRKGDRAAGPDRHRYAFLEKLAHEWKNALTPILSAAQILRRYGAERPDLVDWAGVSIEQQVRQMTAEVNDLLDLARAALGKLELRRQQIDLKLTLEACMEPCRRLADERRLTLEIELPDTDVAVLGDPARLGQAVQQLVFYAITSAPADGHIRLCAAREHRNAVIRVSEKGAGLDPATLVTLFEPFFEGAGSDLARSQTRGVGLALAHSLTAMHGGSLRAHSEGLGRGTEFVLSIPAIPSPAGNSGQLAGNNPGVPVR
jgi:signal transduction histidine kinase